jgi:putative heme utilization carrier protein HutX
MRRFTDGARFVDVMTDVARWGDVTLIVHTDDGIMEFGGAIPAGQISRGYYNVPGTSGFHGHLRHERCSEIAFVERPFMGRNSASILFFNTDGNIMFKIFVGRDADRNLKSDQLEMFRSLASGASQ